MLHRKQIIQILIGGEIVNVNNLSTSYRNNMYTALNYNTCYSHTKSPQPDVLIFEIICRLIYNIISKIFYKGTQGTQGFK